jgi:TolB protein
MTKTLARFTIAWLLAFCAGAATAQGLNSDVPTIDIKNGTASATPIAVVPFAFDGGLPPQTDVADVIRADLNRCGQFRALPKSDIVEFPTRGEEIKFPTWNMLKQAYIVVGRETQAATGEVRVEFELYDVAKQQRLQGLSISGQASDLRGVAHQVADLVY